MKKVLSMIACLSLVVSMFVGMTANAELNYGTPKATATFAGFVDGNLEAIADTATHTGDAYAVIQLSYTGLENLVAYSSSGLGANKKENVTGVAAIKIETTLANNDTHSNIGNASEDDDSTGFGLSCGFDGALIKCGGNASKFNGYLTAAAGDVIKMYVQVIDTTVENTFNLDVADFTIKSIVNSKEVADNSGTISLATEGCTIPAFNAPEEEEEPTAETVAAWDTGDGLLVIGKLLKADAAEYGVNIKDYELPAEATVKAGPDFPALAANPASEAGYYGINIIGIAANTYEVAAYADGVYADAISVTVE